MSEDPADRLETAILKAEHTRTPTASRLLRRIADRLALGARWDDLAEDLAVAVQAVGDLTEMGGRAAPTERDPIALLDALDDALDERVKVIHAVRNAATELPS